MNNPNILFLSIIFFLCLFSNTTFGQSYTSSISTEDYYQAALELHEQGNYSDAEAYYSLALAMDAHCEKCLFNRGLAYVALEKYRKALSDFTLLIEQAPTDIEAYEQRGYLRYQTGDTRGAISDFSAVISYAPSARAYTNRGMAYLEMKQYPDAIRDLEEALRLAPQDGEARRTLGDVYFASNEIEKALAEYNAAIQLNNRDIIAYNNRGNAYQLLGKDEEALADYSMGIALLPNSYTYTNRAKYWIKKENYNKAFTDALAATKLDYNNAEAFYCVGIIKNAQKNYALAYENFNKAIALDHNRGEYYNGRGIALFHLGEYEDASEDFESALHLNPADAAAKDRILDCHKKLNEGAEEAGIAYKEENKEPSDEFTARGISIVSYSSTPSDSPLAPVVIDSEEDEMVVAAFAENTEEMYYHYTKEVLNYSSPASANKTSLGSDQVMQYMQKAADYMQSKWYDQAVQQYSLAIKKDPSLSEAYYKRAQCYMLLKTTDLAIEDLDKYLESVGDDAEAYNDRGTLRFRAGNVFGALEDYNAGLAIKPNHEMLLENRGRWYLSMGYFHEAIRDFSNAMKNGIASADLFYQRALAHFELQDYSAVREDLNYAISYSHIERYEYFFLLAKTLLHSSLYEAALKHFNKTIELSPRFGEGYIYRAICHQHMGNKISACEDYNMAAAMGYNLEEIVDVGKYCE